MRCGHNFNAERTTSAMIVEIRVRAAGGIPHLFSAWHATERKVGAGRRARVGTPSSAEASAARGLKGAGWTAAESGDEPHGERSLAAAIDERISRKGAVLRPLDADEVRREIALLAAAGSTRSPFASCTLAESEIDVGHVGLLRP
jgi:hypothetical protein